MPRWIPSPRERLADRYTRARLREDRAAGRRYGPLGPGGDPYFGGYASRPQYSARRGQLVRPEPGGSSWPERPAELPRAAEARHLRALADRELACAVDAALWNALGPEADRLSVYANDGVITVAGPLPHRGAAHAALEVARRTPGVGRVHNALWPG